MKRHSALVGVVLASFLFMPAKIFAGAIDFSLTPNDGAVAGPPGSTVGWGYSFTNNDPRNWFMASALNSDSFSNGTPVLLFDFPSVGPGTTVSAAFDSGTGAGLYELIWDGGAPVGFTNSGNFVLSGGWWDGDPLNGGNFLFSEPDISLPYTAMVTEGSSAVPEPSTACLCLLFLVPVAYPKLNQWRRVPITLVVSLR